MTKLVVHAVHRSSNLNTEQATSNEDEFERCDSPAYCTDTATGDPVVHTWRVYRHGLNHDELIAEFAHAKDARVFVHASYRDSTQLTHDGQSDN